MIVRNRPPGLAPRGSSWGLGLMSVFAPGIPALSAIALSPWLFSGDDTGLAVAMAAVVAWLGIAVPLVIGFKLRRYWGVVIYFYVGVACAVALPLAVLAVAGVVVALPRPAAFADAWFGLGLVAMLPFWPRLVGALRLKYWQPWTRPDEWEAGDERIAGWVYDAAGTARPPPAGKGRPGRGRS